MGFFNNILKKLGLGNEASAAPANTVTPTPPHSTSDQVTGGQATGEQATGGQTAAGQTVGGTEPAPSAAASQTNPVNTVDVVAQLEQRAAQNPQKLNWKTSIVDLLKLLDIDSSFTARKELAAELGCPPELMADSAQMNTWLHKTVLARIAANGGNIPQDLLH